MNHKNLSPYCSCDKEPETLQGNHFSATIYRSQRQQKYLSLVMRAYVLILHRLCGLCTKKLVLPLHSKRILIRKQLTLLRAILDIFYAHAHSLYFLSFRYMRPVVLMLLFCIHHRFYIFQQKLRGESLSFVHTTQRFSCFYAPLLSLILLLRVQKVLFFERAHGNQSCICLSNTFYFPFQKIPLRNANNFSY